MKKYIKIYGAKRTGTNYITTILHENFLNLETFMNVGGWKHGNIIEFPKKYNLLKYVDNDTKKRININDTINLFKNNMVKFIVTIKNPYMWINSIINYSGIKCIKDNKFIIKQIKLWNKLYNNYKKFIITGKAELVKYEKLLEEPDIILVNLSKKNNWKRKYENSFNLETKYLRANSDNTIGEHYNYFFDKKKYINTDIKKVLTKNTIKIINDNIDLSLLEFYKYELI